jgi:hypothetical protein
MNFQFYTPNWWKLWPTYMKRYENLYDDQDPSGVFYTNTFTFGPFQFWWYSK